LIEYCAHVTQYGEQA